MVLGQPGTLDRFYPPQLLIKFVHVPVQRETVHQLFARKAV